MDHNLFRYGPWRQRWQEQWGQMLALVAPVAKRARVTWNGAPRWGRWASAGAVGLVTVAVVAAGVANHRSPVTIVRTPITNAPILAPSLAPSAVANGHVFVRNAQGAWVEVTPKAKIGAKDLVAANFVTDKTGWVTVGHRSERHNDVVEVYRTTDGGANWSKVTLDQFGPFQLSALQTTFVNAQDGWALVSLSEITNNRPGVLYRTIDGGANWTRIQAPVGGALQFMSESAGWIIGGRVNYVRNLIYVTQDGGQTWVEQRLDLPPGYANANVMIGAPVFFSARSGAIAVNLEKIVEIYLTADGGRTWTGAYSFPLPPADHLALPILAAHGANALLTVGSGVYTTADSGARWAQVNANAKLGSALTLGMNDGKDGWAVIARGWCPAQFTSRCNNTQLIATHDGGITWAPVKA